MATKAVKGFMSYVNFISVGQVTPCAHPTLQPERSCPSVPGDQALLPPVTGSEEPTLHQRRPMARDSAARAGAKLLSHRNWWFLPHAIPDILTKLINWVSSCVIIINPQQCHAQCTEKRFWTGQLNSGVFPQTGNNAEISWQTLCPKVFGITHDFCDVVSNSDKVNNLILQFV